MIRAAVFQAPAPRLDPPSYNASVTDGWICDTCGEIAVGDLCKHCGRQRPTLCPIGPKAGSYLSLIGYRTMDSFKFPALLYAFVAVAFLAILGIASISFAWKICGAVVLLVYLWRRAPVVYYSIRRGISRRN
jgi:hypothetical protein